MASLAERTAPRYKFPEFRPHPLLRSGHAQTIAGVVAPHRRIPYRAVRHHVDLTLGDRAILHDDCPSTWSHGDRCVLLIHGLGGCHLSPYMVRITARLNERAARVFRIDLRGYGDGWELARHPGHAGRSEDVRATIDKVLSLCPDSPLAVAAVSMGANLILKLLGEYGADAPRQLDRVLAVSPPLDLEPCSKHMLAPAQRIYSRAFVRELWRQLERRKHLLHGLDQLRLDRRPANLWEFDDQVTAPLSGYRNAEHYYEEASSKRVLERIQVPTIVLAAADDPLIPIDVITSARLSPSTRLHVTRYGGHIGFLGAGGSDPDRRWLDWRVVEWSEA